MKNPTFMFILVLFLSVTSSAQAEEVKPEPPDTQSTQEIDNRYELDIPTGFDLLKIGMTEREVMRLIHQKFTRKEYSNYANVIITRLVYVTWTYEVYQVILVNGKVVSLMAENIFA